MEATESIIAVLQDHKSADIAIKNLISSGFEMRALSVVGKGFHTEEQVIGFYTIGDRIKFWGSQGAFWGGLWGIFFGGLMLTVPVLGQVVVLGSLAATIVAAIEGAAVVGGLSSLGGALYALGVPRDKVIKYELAVKVDGFLVMAHGTEAEIARAKSILQMVEHLRLEIHMGRTMADWTRTPAVVLV
jgi:hypothetical protein